MVKAYRLFTDYYAKEFVISMKILECFLIIAVGLWMFIYFWILKNKPFCHPNLWLLLILQPLSHYSVLILRLVRHVMEVAGILNDALLDYINMATDVGLLTATTLMCALSVERLIATIFASKYEQMNRRVPVISIILFLVVVTYATVFEQQVYAERISHPVAYIVVGTMFSVATVFFAILPLISRRRRDFVAKTKTTTVSERYQTIENERCAQLLKFVSAYKSSTNILSLIFYIYAFEVLDQYYIPLAGEIYFYFNILQLSCQMLLTIVSHRTLRQQLKYLICKNGQAISDCELNPRMKSVSGQRMMFSVEEERERYFQIYSDSWGVMTGEKREIEMERKENEEGRKKRRMNRNRKIEYTVNTDDSIDNEHEQHNNMVLTLTTSKLSHMASRENVLET